MFAPSPGCDAVGINCKNGLTTNNQGTGVKYVGKECMSDGCVCYLTYHDYPSLVERKYGILILLFNKRY